MRYSDEEFAQVEFTCGYCHCFALALHQKTGWPIYCDDNHYWVVNPEGNAVDIAGVHESNYAVTEWNDPDPTAVRGITLGELEPCNDEILQWAIEVIEQNPDKYLPYLGPQP
jgi:hypothetical protein